MVDYTKATGSAGRLIIRDDGEWVSFWLSCSDPVTNVGSAGWSGYAEGSRSGAFSWASGGGTRKIAGPWLVTKTQTVTFAIGSTGTQGLGGPTSLSQVISRARPTAPFGLSLSRISDSQQTLNWSRYGGYSSQLVQRRVNDGSWQQIASINGTAITFTDKATAGNRKYAYRVAAVAASGQSDWSNIDTIYTTPGVPSGVKAVRDGSNIVVSASSVPPYASGFDVRDGSTVVASNVSLPYTHVSPSTSVPHTYTVRAVRTSPDSLASGWSSPSNTVQLLTKPNAPTGLNPNGAVWPSDTDVLFRWSHNAVDSSPQSAFELQYRVNGGAWTTVTGTTVSEAAVPVAESSVEWQVRTKGAHPDWSDWSAVASVTVIDRPGVAIIRPAGSWDASVLVPEWTWFQAQGRPQSGWRVELLDGGAVVVESRNGSGGTTALQLNTRLTEGTYTVRVQAATGEVWSLWASETFTVVFDPPAEPVLSGVWDEGQGGVQIAVTGEEFGSAVLDGGVWYAEVGD